MMKKERPCTNKPLDIMKANALKEFTTIDITGKKSISRSIAHFNLNRIKKQRLRREISESVDNFLSNGGHITILPPKED
jgi:hypothetical protein